MKRIHLLWAVGALTFFTAASANGQTNTVGIGTTTPNTHAVLDLVSPTNNQGLLAPRMTTAQRTASLFVNSLTAVDNGLLIYDTTLNLLFFWSTDQWIPVKGGADLVAGAGLTISGNVISSTDGDTDPANEFQDLRLTGNTLSLTNDATTVNLAPYLQDLSLASNILSLSGDATTVNLNSYLDNTDAQNLGLTGNSLSITGGNSVDLTPIIPAIGSSSGTQNFISKWNNTGGTTLGNSSITDNGTMVSVNGSNFSINLNSASVAPMLDLVQSNTGDAAVSFTRLATDFAMGIDGSDGDKFKIASNASLGTNDRLVIQPNGNIGIGTSSPIRPLHIYSTNANVLGANGVFMDVQNSNLNSGAMTGIRFKMGTVQADDSYKGGVFFQSNCTSCFGRGNLIFSVNGTNDNSNVTTADTRMTINSGGVSISNTLELLGPVIASGSEGTPGFSLTSNGPGVAPSWTLLGIIGSDERLKKNIQTLDYGLNEILALRPARYQMRTGDGSTHLGLIAQELKLTIPELVVTNPSTGLYGVNYIELIPVLINAVKDQQKIIDGENAKAEKLEAQLNEQDQRIQKLEAILEATSSIH